MWLGRAVENREVAVERLSVRHGRPASLRTPGQSPLGRDDLFVPEPIPAHTARMAAPKPDFRKQIGARAAAPGQEIC